MVCSLTTLAKGTDLMNATTAVVRLRPDAVSWREVDGEIVALDRRSGDYLAISPTGAGLWAQLVEGATEAHLADELAARYDLDRARAERDVAVFIEALEARGLVVRGGAS